MSAYHRCWTPQNCCVRCNRVPSNFGVTIFRVTRFRQIPLSVLVPSFHSSFLLSIHVPSHLQSSCKNIKFWYLNLPRQRYKFSETLTFYSHLNNIFAKTTEVQVFSDLELFTHIWTIFSLKWQEVQVFSRLRTFYSHLNNIFAKMT